MSLYHGLVATLWYGPDVDSPHGQLVCLAGVGHDDLHVFPLVRPRENALNFTHQVLHILSFVDRLDLLLCSQLVSSGGF